MSKQSVNGKANGEQMASSMPITVKAQYTKDLSFENPNIIKMLTELKEAPQISVNVHVDATPLKNNDFEVVLSIRAEAQEKEEKLFLVELSYGGIFSIAQEIPEESVRPLVLIECPRILFPFARNIVADVTRDGSMPPLLLNPVDFVALYQQQANSGENKEEN